MSWEDYDYMMNDEPPEPDLHVQVTLQHETEKAQLFRIKNKLYWVPKSLVVDWIPESNELWVEGWFHMTEAK
jgi:hypothetical protein